MGELDCRLHDNLIYENKNGEGKKRKIFGKGKLLFAGEQGNIWIFGKEIYFLAEEKKNREGTRLSKLCGF